MNSIKTFWSPELKKERALRKDEATKMTLWKEQYRVVQEETQVGKRRLCVQLCVCFCGTKSLTVSGLSLLVAQSQRPVSN